MFLIVFNTKNYGFKDPLRRNELGWFLDGFGEPTSSEVLRTLRNLCLVGWVQSWKGNNMKVFSLMVFWSGILQKKLVMSPHTSTPLGLHPA